MASRTRALSGRLSRTVTAPLSAFRYQTAFHTPRRQPLLSATTKHIGTRYESSSTPSASTPPLSDRLDKASEPNPEREEVPSYELTFTCRKCLDRSSHRISKQAYHHGTTLITCPGCQNRHLISDHLKIFSDRSKTLEDILKDKGQMLKKGTLSAAGDVEFWDNGTETKREG